MAVLGPRFCVRAFSSCGEQGPLFIAVRGPLTVAASLVAERKLQTCRLSSCGSRAHLLCGMWDPPRPGLEPVSPALTGRLPTTAPPGKSREFLISFIMLFIIVCLLFCSSRSLLNVSYIFSILFPRFWIIFTIITLNSFSGRLSVSSSFVWSGGFLFCSFICCVFLCLLILLTLLCLGSPFRRLQVCSSCCFWCLSPVGKWVV